jgi:hypothetical protein
VTAVRLSWPEGQELVLGRQRRDAVLDRLNELPNLALDTGKLRTAARQAGAMLHPQAIQLAHVLSAEVLEEISAHQLVAKCRENAFLYLLSAIDASRWLSDEYRA